MNRPIAALFVEAGGIYYGLDGVDPWPLLRDARLFNGIEPVIAHPPCERWGRYWRGGPNRNKDLKLGDDGGCFEFALAAVRRNGGVIEHPEATKAYDYFGIKRPPRDGGWIVADDFGGYTCCVAQGNYGHKANKFTWLYAVRTDRPGLKWGKSEARARLDKGNYREYSRDQLRMMLGMEFLTSYGNRATPVEFRDLLIELARSVQ